MLFICVGALYMWGRSFCIRVVAWLREYPNVFAVSMRKVAVICFERPSERVEAERTHPNLSEQLRANSVTRLGRVRQSSF